MKLILNTIIIMLMLIGNKSNGQTVSPSVLPSAGGYYEAGNASLSWTIGEAVTNTLQTGSNVLSQGFQQPEVQVKTGTLSGPFCPGQNVLVPFISYGIFSIGNIFTAQLSNAVGSFSSPVAIGTIAGNMATGTISAVIPIGTANGSAYRIRVISSIPVFAGPDNGTNISISNTCSITLNLKFFLQGYYTSSGNMTPVLLNQGASANNTIVDSVTVELHSSLSPWAVIASTNVILNTNGTCTCNFPVAAGDYYIVVQHRNSVQTWSASPVTFGVSSTFYNFSVAASKAYGNNQVLVGPGVFALYSGDINQDENIDLIDLANLENDVSNFEFGYFATDINGDGNVDLLDVPILENNVNDFIFSNHP